MSRVLFVHGMRMQGQVPDDVRREWNEGLATILAATPWGTNDPAGVAAWSNADLAYWADLFEWPDQGPLAEATKGINLAALLEKFYAIPRASVLAADAAATHSPREGRPESLVAMICDSLVEQTAVYMHNGPTFGANPKVIERNQDVFGPDTAPWLATAQGGRGAYFAVQARIERALKHDTRIVIGHSLGSVIAYEALCRLKHRVHTFVTIGSPMATPELILQPLKQRLARTLRHDPSLPLPWPMVADWVNFYALADVWCVPVPRLAPSVHPRIRDIALQHGTMFKAHKTHLLTAYLAHQEIGNEIAHAVEAIGEQDAEPQEQDAGGPTAEDTPRKGRRLFAAIGVANPGTMTPLPEVPRDLARMRGIFEGALGYERFSIPDEPAAETLRSALTAGLDAAELGPDDSLVLYYSGHGHFERDVHYLCTRGFRADAIGGAFRSRELAEIALRRTTAPGRVWIILDCCQAGDALHDLAQEMEDDSGARYAMASTGAYGLSFDGAFTKAFVAVVGRPAPILSQNDLALGMDDILRASGRSPVRKHEPPVASSFDFLQGLRRDAIPAARVAKRRRLAPWILAASLVGLVAASGGALGWRFAHQAPQVALAAAAEAAPQGMVVVPGGTAVLGTDDAAARRMFVGCSADKKASCGTDFESSVFARQVGWAGAELVRVSRFELDTREVTRGQFAIWLEERRDQITAAPDRSGAVRLRDGQGNALATVGTDAANGSGIAFSGGHFQAADDGSSEPAAQVSWYGASIFCHDQHKRLPTEEEWEFAARGAQGRRFPWGDADPAGTGIAYAATQCRGDRCTPAAVGSSSADRTLGGIFDLTANVREWTSSSFEGTTAEERAQCKTLHCRVVRGAGYRDTAAWLSPSIRRDIGADQQLDDVGFRCARDGEP